MMKPTKGLSVDAGTRGNPGECFYRGVDLESGKQLFYKELGMGTNNIGEFLAVVHAIHYLAKHNINLPIYSDSVTAMAWVSKMEANTTFEGDITPRIKKACDYLKKIVPPTILKWKTKEWGEIPADFGRK